MFIGCERSIGGTESSAVAKKGTARRRCDSRTNEEKRPVARNARNVRAALFVAGFFWRISRAPVESTMIAKRHGKKLMTTTVRSMGGLNNSGGCLERRLSFVVELGKVARRTIHANSNRINPRH